MNKCNVILTMIFIAMSIQIVSADLPRTFNYQGRLTSSEGTIVADGTYSLTMSLYESESGGSPIWTGVYSATTQQGYFGIVLGSSPAPVFPDSMDFSVQYWLEIKIGSDEPLTPRQKISSIPYAIRADTVMTVPQVHSGERDITDYSSGVFYTKLTRTPRKMTLSLHLKQFNSIFYREIARHTHSVSTSGTSGNDNSSHSHYLRVSTGYGNYASGYYVSNGTGADHLATGWVGSVTSNHTHNFSVNTTAGASGGNDGSTAISGVYTAKSYLADLKIKINGVEKTTDIISRAQALGQISGGNIANTDSIDISVEDFSQWQIGENSIEFYQDSVSGGGKVIYDLYIWY